MFVYLCAPGGAYVSVVDVCMWVLMSRPACEGQKRMSGVFFRYSSHCRLRQSLFLGLELHSWAGLEVSMPAPVILLP